MPSSANILPRQRPERVKQPRPPSDVPIPPSWSAPPADADSSDEDNDTFHDARFPPDEEDRLLAESHSIKASANTQFAASDFSQAISTYDRALASLPNYLDFEIAVLQSNIAACHIKLEEWKEAIESADKALDALDREDPPLKTKERKKRNQKKQKQANADTSSDEESDKPPLDPNATVVELPSSDDEDTTAAALKKLNISDERVTSINRIRTKSLLRRARARSSFAKSPAAQNKTIFSSAAATHKDSGDSGSGSPWTLLSAALADYQTLSKSYASLLPPSDRRTVNSALAALPGEIEEAKGKETAEMMGKLKDLGNTVLKPFGLSTNNFKMVQDPKTGGYSLSFEQGAK